MGAVSEEVRAVSRERPVGAPRRRLQIQRSQGVGETVPQPGKTDGLHKQ